MKKINVLLVAVFVIIVQGCATPALTKSSLAFDEKTSEKGLIIGSVTFPQEKALFTHYFFGVNPTDGINKFNEIQITPDIIISSKHKGQMNKGKTYLIALQKEPGTYQINMLRLHSQGYAYSQGGHLDNFAIPFEVKKGEITYIGEIFFDEYASDSDTLIKLSDQYQRDIDYFKSSRPATDWGSAKKGTLKITYKK